MVNQNGGSFGKGDKKNIMIEFIVIVGAASIIVTTAVIAVRAIQQGK
jgi:hypothetical protein